MGTYHSRLHGQAAPLVPILIALVALRALGGQGGSVLQARHYLGGFLFGMAVVGSSSSAPGLANQEAGGYLGLAVATLALRFLGELGSGLGLFVVGAFAVFLLAGTDLQTFWADLRAFLLMVWRGLRAVGRVLAGMLQLSGSGALGGRPDAPILAIAAGV